MAERVSIIGSSTSTGAPTWRDDELQALEKHFLAEGVITGLAVSQHASGANMSVDLAVGQALIEITNTNLSAGETYKVYYRNTAVKVISVPTADATNPRKDRIVVKINVGSGSVGSANPDAAAANIGEAMLIAGTPAGSPSAPAEPANSITLAIIDVPASDTTISTGQITDSRGYVTLKDTTVLADIARATETAALRADSVTWLGTITGTNTLTGTATPAPTAYADGQRFAFFVANTNTAAVMLNVASLGAIDLVRPDGSALQSGDLKANGIAEVRKKGSQFLLTSQMHSTLSPTVVPLFVTYADSANADNGTTSWVTFTFASAKGSNTLAANSLAVGDRVLIRCTQNNNGGTRNIRMQVAGSTIFTENTLPTDSTLLITLTVRGTLGASCSIGYTLEHLKTGADAYVASGTFTMDTTQARAITFDGQQTAGAETTHVIKSLTIDQLKTP